MYIFESVLLMYPTLNDIERQLSDEFKKISNDDIKTQEKIYYSNEFADIIKNGKNIGSFFWNVKHSYDCCMFESLVTTYDARKLECHLFSTCRDDYEFAVDAEAMSELMKNDANWLDYMKHSAFHAAVDICKYFRLAPWQFSIVEIEENRTQFIIVSIPDIRDNIEQIKRVFSFYGYVLGRLYDLESSWKQLEFHPRFQQKINEEIRKHKYLYHIAPERCVDKIMRQGLVAKSSNMLYDYPGRVYLILDNIETPDGLFCVDRRLLIMFARKLYGEKKQVNKPEYVNDKSFCIFRIDISKINDSVDFYNDFTEDSVPAIFTADYINPDALEVLEVVDFSKPISFSH